MVKPSRRAGTNGSAYQWLLFLYDETIPATNNHAESRRAGTASGGDHAQARRVQSRRAGTAGGAAALDLVQAAADAIAVITREASQ